MPVRYPIDGNGSNIFCKTLLSHAIPSVWKRAFDGTGRKLNGTTVP